MQASDEAVHVADQGYVGPTSDVAGYSWTVLPCEQPDAAGGGLLGTASEVPAASMGRAGRCRCLGDKGKAEGVVANQPR
jgi:hypothetical protein